MRKTIRYGVFETNSSSCHSIVIADKWPGEADYGSYWTRGGQFGRYAEGVLDDVNSRLDYLWQVILDNSSAFDSGEGPESIEEWRRIIGEYLPCANLDVEWDSYGMPSGWVDHGGEYADMLRQMYDDPELTARFLLGKDSRVFMSSDENYLPRDYPSCDYIEFSN